MGKKELGGITGVAFYLVVGFLLVWTASLDYNFIRRVVDEQRFLAIFGLVLFDGGLLGWLTTYIYRARGTTQRMLSLGMTLLSLLGIGIISAAELLEQAGELVRFDIQNLPTIVVVLISTQTFLFVAATVGYHLSDPEIIERVNLQVIEDQVIAEAFELVEANKKETATKLANEMAEQIIFKLVKKVDMKLDPETKWEYEIKRHKPGYTNSKGSRNKQRALNRRKRAAAKKRQAQAQRAAENEDKIDGWG